MKGRAYVCEQGGRVLVLCMMVVGLPWRGLAELLAHLGRQAAPEKGVFALPAPIVGGATAACVTIRGCCRRGRSGVSGRSQIGHDGSTVVPGASEEEKAASPSLASVPAIFP